MTEASRPRSSLPTLFAKRSPRSYARLVANEPGLWLGRDPGGGPPGPRRACAGSAPISGRSHRSSNADWANNLRGELRWLGAELGVVRDLEVMRDRLRDHARSLPPAECETARRVVRRLDADREGARRDLLEMLGEPRYAKLRARARPRIVAAALAPTAPARTLAPALAPVVRERWKKLRSAVEELGEHPPDEALHAVRIRAKRCRYAAEAVVPAFGEVRPHDSPTASRPCRTSSASIRTRWSRSRGSPRPRTNALPRRRTRLGCSRRSNGTPRPSRATPSRRPGARPRSDHGVRGCEARHGSRRPAVLSCATHDGESGGARRAPAPL